MASSKLSLIFCVVSCLPIWAVVVGATHHQEAAPAPSVDCSTLILRMADCLSYVSNDSTVTKPEATCCSGLKTVLQTDAECLCEAFKNSAQLGVVLNVTKALSLPTACKIHAPSISNCGLSLAPASSPGSYAAAPSMAPGVIVQPPAPSPGVSGSHGSSISVGSLLIGLVVALFSGF